MRETTSRPHDEPATPDQRSGRAADRRWPWVVVRVVAVLQALDALLQPVLAGRFLSGEFDMLVAHKHNAIYGVFILSILLIAAAALAWRLVDGPGWLVITATVLTGAVLVQIILGFDRVLGIHVPLGVAIVGISGWLAVWMCGHEPTDRVFTRSRQQDTDRERTKGAS